MSFWIDPVHILTTQEIREILYIGKNKFYELLDSGELIGFKIGRNWRVSKSALVEFIDKNEKKAIITRNNLIDILGRENIGYQIY